VTIYGSSNKRRLSTVCAGCQPLAHSDGRVLCIRIAGKISSVERAVWEECLVGDSGVLERLDSPRPVGHLRGRDALVPFEKLLGLLGISFCAADPD
jgi:hypothetical protein